MAVSLIGAVKTIQSLLVGQATFHKQLLCLFIPQAVMSWSVALLRWLKECCGFGSRKHPYSVLESSGLIITGQVREKNDPSQLTNTDADRGGRKHKQSEAWEQV